jgi:glycosyltransferase involved in cell wall biosynthesis
LAAAVEKLLADRHLRESMGRQSNSDVISQYTWEKVAQPIKYLYEKVGLCRGECK